MRYVFLCAALVGFASGVTVPASGADVNSSNSFENLLKHYPKRALAAREQGLVGFKITLDHAGHPTACEVTHSSGHPMLDNETCDLMLTNVTFQPPRDAQGNRLRTQTTTGTMNWRLPGAQLVTEARKVAASDPGQKKVCKRTPRTGSLAGFDRVCMTSREWDRQRAEAAEGVAGVQGKGFTSDKQ